MTQLVTGAAAGSIVVEAEGGTTVVRLVGEIDGALRDQASHGMGLALFADQRVVIDATATTFIDSSGLAFVLQLHLAAQEAGMELRLRDPRRVLRDVLDTVGLAEHIPDEEPAAG
ncbi:STAS domain-containing protein [Cellulomonas endophytica]|uniref:STAS domain-containing protein n=1 Tax=Cellulomonas endophytica TaxID=2494735 RepID=UPI0010104ACA|nr:STAS domain-containing protein [Cellulomonas endophytica]